MSRYKVYEFGNKMRQLLHWLPLTEESTRIVPELCSAMGPVVTSLAEITSVFADYYRALYRARPPRWRRAHAL